MRKEKKILDGIISSERNARVFPSHQLVWEWEQKKKKILKVRIIDYSFLRRMEYKVFRWLHLVPLFQKMLPSSNLSLKYVVNAELKPFCEINRNTIPAIVDFWLEEDDLPEFWSLYKNCPLVLVSNREVYDFLSKHPHPVPVEHWPLSYPDRYELKENDFEKEYEFCIIGRANPFFLRMLDRYSKSHPDFRYILNNDDISHRKYVTNDGICISDDNSRESYFNMIKKTKISCYTTPGLDEAKKETSRYNQVTPRVMELLCNGCQVIGHYPMTADVCWYKLYDVVPNVDTYEEFEVQLDRMREESFDFEKVKAFMSNHYTSTRAKMLKDILERHDIIIKVGQK